MKALFSLRAAVALIVVGTSFFNSLVAFGDVLVADRLTNSVYRYTDNGTFSNVVVASSGIYQPTSIAMSADGSQFYVTTSNKAGGNELLRYDYNRFTGIASNEKVFASLGTSSFPSSVILSPDGNRVFVSDLNTLGVSQFNLDGSSAGAVIGTGNSLSGLAFAPDGNLMAAVYADAFFANGAVLKSDAGLTTLDNFIAPSPTLTGASSLLIHGNDLYVTAMFGKTEDGVGTGLSKYNLDPITGNPTLDMTFGVKGSLDLFGNFPQGLMLSPDGKSMLVGILGGSNGAGHIADYGFDGTLLGTFLTPGAGGSQEATAFAYVAAVPEPGTIGLFAIAGTTLAAAVRRRKLRGKEKLES